VATELHQLEHDPPFSFSELIPTAPYNVGDDGLAITQGLFAFTSDRSEILDAIASYAMAGNLTLGHSALPVIGTDIEPVHGVERATYRTVSPVCASQYIDDRREYLGPDDGMWYARLRDSVRDRLNGEWGLPGDFEFSVDEIHWTKRPWVRSSSKA
jgi:CRISPR/Cas system endoribonuclease Cas6 (RAMP superfamily)